MTVVMVPACVFPQLIYTLSYPQSVSVFLLQLGLATLETQTQEPGDTDSRTSVPVPWGPDGLSRVRFMANAKESAISASGTGGQQWLRIAH